MSFFPLAAEGRNPQSVAQLSLLRPTACLYKASMAAMMRNLRALRRSPIKQVFILAFILFNIFEVAQILRCLSSPTNEPVAQRSERVYIASIH